MLLRKFGVNMLHNESNKNKFVGKIVGLILKTGC